jgi:glutathione synthase/RimK-type ligase-like ATP-grasp enzyme
MTKTLLFFTPDPETPSHHGRWPYVLDAYREALSGLDVEIFDAPWSEPLMRDYDLIVPLVAWGYHNAPERFRAMLAGLKADDKRIFNPADIVSWNVDKRYLRDLAQAGVRVIPTRFADRVTEALLKETTADFGDALVVKPVVSAGAKNTLVWKDGDVLAFDAIEDKAGPPKGEAMIQPFMPAIQSEGEWSLLFFAGEFSHAVLKTPKSGDFRSQPDYQANLRALTPPPEALLLAAETIDFIGADRLLYARVDMVRDADSRFCLMELELIEPDLYLAYADGAAARFAHAVEIALFQGCSCHS